MSRILICFDGSEGAGAAVKAAGELFPGAQAFIVHVWHPPVLYESFDYGANVISPEAQSEVVAAAESHAADVAEQGAGLAREAGLSAEAKPTEAVGSAWRAILAVAEDLGADAIVAGSRGRGGLKSMVLGSTSAALSHHSRRPLLIVPTPEA